MVNIASSDNNNKIEDSITTNTATVHKAIEVLVKNK